MCYAFLNSNYWSDWKNYEDKHLQHKVLSKIINLWEFPLWGWRCLFQAPYNCGRDKVSKLFVWQGPGIGAHQHTWELLGTPLHTAPVIAKGCCGDSYRVGGVIPKTSVALCTLTAASSTFSLMLNSLLQVIPLMSVGLLCNKMLSDKNMDMRIWPCLH